MPQSTDVLIIGSGIMGAAVARGLRDADPTVSILMIDGGPSAGSVPGLHLHDSEEPEIWSRYNQRVATGVQGLYTGADVTPDITDELRSVVPGMYNLSAMGGDARAMPASAVAWNVGGMGVHWTAATPGPPATRSSTTATRRSGPPISRAPSSCSTCTTRRSGRRAPGGWSSRSSRTSSGR
ncbi:hypothetical protein Q0F99_08605 [Rathayibacter oskolensis]|uniref:hypothetical protein n=1 Tax=Rathayibacter oskolensis TaxID=1891671 RepID=UPI00265F2180|nr:hypothetical protein [Rathayibacter oskolensis]WKK72916.1 hypothetical protein Q0F99_08605 [Rathayibacter oskolensis]